MLSRRSVQRRPDPGPVPPAGRRRHLAAEVIQVGAETTHSGLPPPSELEERQLATVGGQSPSLVNYRLRVAYPLPQLAESPLTGIDLNV